MTFYRLFGSWRRFNENKIKKFLKKHKDFKIHYIPTRDWYIVATDSQWEGRERQTIDYLIEQRMCNNGK